MQLVDIILMFVVIEVLHNYYHSGCFSESLCNGYFTIFVIKIAFTLVPIMFNFFYVTHKKRFHIHMILLNTFTNLPLIFIVLMTKGYDVHPFVFFDIIVKVTILLISYSYHLVINVFMEECKPNK
eukprot:TRINITY_DN422_c0_g1_i1.p1 TRINITY_DN422_c0_g1~~TRINITY_DN422_c0_g1_i1.p1  ORF type:complete len:125 (+),score=7.10 TRINITY_DN422_c0_g1_i1:169-543(+)